MTHELTEAQERVFDKVVDSGGDSGWVPVDDGEGQLVEDLESCRVVQTMESDGKKYVALAGVLLEEDAPIAEESEDGPTADTEEPADDGAEAPAEDPAD